LKYLKKLKGLKGKKFGLHGAASQTWAQNEKTRRNAVKAQAVGSPISFLDRAKATRRSKKIADPKMEIKTGQQRGQKPS